MNQANASVNIRSPETVNPRKRKRQASEVAGQYSGTERHLSTHSESSSTHHHPSSFGLSTKVDLTYRALEEFDRKDSLIARQTPPAPTPIDNPSEVLPSRRGEVSAELRRFARSGGPDLCDLKGFPQPVSLNMARTKESKQQSSQSSTAASSKKRKAMGQGGDEDVSSIPSTIVRPFTCLYDMCEWLDISDDSTCTIYWKMLLTLICLRVDPTTRDSLESLRIGTLAGIADTPNRATSRS